MSDEPNPTSPDEMENCRRPNMMPRQWDLSELLAAQNKDRRQKETAASTSHPEENADDEAEPSLFDPYPETNTMPSGWDLSEL